MVYGIFSAAGGLYAAIVEIDRDLPDDLTTALDYRPNRASLVYSSDGELIGEFFLQKRVLVAFERIPLHVQQAFISAEDKRFVDHPGFDLVGIARAAIANWRGHGTQQGASTITQQVTRMLMLTNEKTVRRKAREVVLSVRVERELSKRDILHIYLNHVYLGHGAYGVQAAAEVYFGKDVDHLTIAEGALLAGLVQAPSTYSPHNHMNAARDRQRYVLGRMQQDGYITDAQRDASLAEPIALVDNERPLNHVAAPYFVEHVRKWATERFGEDSVLHGGLRIYTTLDTRMQRSAEAAVHDGLHALDRRIGFRGPVGRLAGDDLTAFTEGPPRPYVHGLEGAVTGGGTLLPDVTYVGVVTELKRTGGIVVDLGPRTLAMDSDDARRVATWRGEGGERIATGDLLPVTLAEDRKGVPIAELTQAPDVQGAMVVIDPATGRVEAMVGGYDYVQSQFNRATQAKRQIGSAMKPFIYATALQNGTTHLDIIQDAPVAVKTATGVWAPKNYNREYEGPVTVRTGIAKSINTVSVRLLLRTGLDKVITMMKSLGIKSKIPRHVSLALGTPDLSLLEVTAANAAFASGGRLVTPRFVDVVVSGRGDVLLDRSRERSTLQVISPQLAYLVADLMQAVVARGTGRRAQALGRPAAGKTGTSTGHRDAWFIGYTADRIAGVWVGRDDFTPIGARATGSSAALPIWLQFMRAAHPNTPPRPFEPPPDIIFVRANELTGSPLPPGSSAGRLVPFARGTVPERFMKSIEPSPFHAIATRQ